jgi:hypothetical protein
MIMPERITQEDLLEHCLNAVRRHPYDRIGLEHFIFMKLLEDCPPSKFEELVSLYQWTVKE